MNRRSFVGGIIAGALAVLGIQAWPPRTKSVRQAFEEAAAGGELVATELEYRHSDRSTVILLRPNWTLTDLQVVFDRYQQQFGYPLDLRMTHASRRRFLSMCQPGEVVVIQTPAGFRDRFTWDEGPSISIDESMYRYSEHAMRIVWPRRMVSPFLGCEG